MEQNNNTLTINPNILNEGNQMEVLDTDKFIDGKIM